MKKELMFELTVTDSLKIRVYADDDFDNIYEDSHLYLVYNGKEKHMLQYSFVYEFGLEMYQRLFNIYDYEEKLEIEKYRENFLNIDWDSINMEEFIINSTKFSIDKYNATKYVFVECDNNYELLLYKKESKYLFSIVKYNRHKTKTTYKSKLLCTYELSEEQINDWKEKVSTSFSIMRRKKEERKGLYKSDKEWNRYMEIMKYWKKNKFESLNSSNK